MVEIALVSGIGFAGIFIRGLTGFGSALIMMPLLLLLFDIQVAVVITTIVEIAGCLSITLQSRRHIGRHHLKIVLPLTLAGILLGAFILVNFDSLLLKRIFGGFTVLFALRILWKLYGSVRPRSHWPRGAGYVAGALGGVLGGLFGTAGPPITIYLENQIADKDVLRATLLAYFMVLDSTRLVLYGVANIVTREVLFLSLMTLPGALLGAYLGRFVNMGINDKVFRTLISVILVAMGTLLVLGR